MGEVDMFDEAYWENVEERKGLMGGTDCYRRPMIQLLPTFWPNLSSAAYEFDPSLSVEDVLRANGYDD